MAAKSAYAKTVGYELLHAARLHRLRMAQLLQEIGLFPGQEQVLAALLARDGLAMSELARLLRVRPPTASKTIARLAVQGLVERRSGEGDGRMVRVWLTGEGRRRAGLLDGLWLVVEQEVAAGLDNKERKRLRRSLRDVRKRLERAVDARGSGMNMDADTEDSDTG